MKYICNIADWKPGQALGKLGPDVDPEELAEKRQRQERIKAYAEAVRHENKQVCVSVSLSVSVVFECVEK